MRTAEITRNTAETQIGLRLNIDGSGKSSIASGVGFMDHMLTLFAKHGRFDLVLKCEGDTYVDDHHSTEDIGIALGCAFKEALGDKLGIERYGQQFIPMDEALVLTCVDISGRGSLNYGLEIPTEKIGSFDTELVEEFWKAFAINAGITLHIKQLDGRNSHHIVEAAFKSAARSLKAAATINPEYAGEIMSTKGVL